MPEQAPLPESVINQSEAVLSESGEVDSNANVPKQEVNEEAEVALRVNEIINTRETDDWKLEQLIKFVPEHNLLILEQLLTHGVPGLQKNFLQRAYDSDHQKYVEEIISANKSEMLVQTLHFLPDVSLGQEIAEQLVKVNPDLVTDNATKFDFSDYGAIVKKILDASPNRDLSKLAHSTRDDKLRVEIVAQQFMIDELQGKLDREMSYIRASNWQLLAERVFALGGIEKLSKYYLKSFYELDYSLIIQKLIDAQVSDELMVAYLPYNSANPEMAELLIKSGYGKSVAKCFSSFYKEYDDIVPGLKRLIDVGVVGAAEGLDEALRRMDKGSLDRQFAKELLKAGQYDVVVKYLDKFEPPNQEIAELLIEGGKGEAVAKKIKSFQNLDYQKIAELLIGRANNSAADLSAFNSIISDVPDGSLGQSIVIQMAEKNEFHYFLSWSRKFTHLNPQEIAERLIDIGVGAIVFDSFESRELFKNLDLQKLQEYTITNGNYLFLLQSQDIFSVDENVFERVIGGGYKELFTDANVLAQFEQLKNLIGETKWAAVFRNSDFWKNTHDDLLFVEDLMTKSPEERQKIADLVLKPFWAQINTAGGFRELRENLQAFDLEKYRVRNDGETPPFVNYQAFGREAMLQRYDIRIPEDASENFAAAMEGLMEAKNVDVSFLRAIIDQYRGVNVSVSRMRQIADERLARGDDEDWDNDIELAEYREYFISRLINIIEGRDQIDEQKMIAPHRETMPLDPLHDLAFNTVGIHSLNQKGLKLAELVTAPEGLGKIFELLQTADEQTKIRINENKKQALEKDRQNGGRRKDRLTAEYQKRLDVSLLTKGILEKKDARINQSNIEDLPLLLDEGQLQRVGDEFAKLLDNDQALKQLMIEVYTDLAAKGPAVGRMIEWEQFVSLVSSGEKLGQRLEEITQSLLAEKSLTLEQLDKPMRAEFLATIRREFPVEQLREIAGDDFVKLALFSLYLGLNNRQKASESKDLKNGLDQILNVKKYKEQTKNPSLDYLQGKLAIDGVSEARIRQLLDQYGYLTAGRQLELKIAKGSDYTAWTAGDQTDCCMPFASEKNREYLLRPDTAYFVCSIVDENGQSEIIAQSVLVAAKDEVQPQTQVTAFDNIEIANRAIKYRPVITQAYERMKQVLIERFETEKQQPNHQYERLKLLIGTTYNDDGGLITGGLPATEIDSISPIEGSLIYSDCFERDHAHLYYDSEAKQMAFVDYGLQIDLFERSKIKEIVKEPATLQKIKELLEKIGEGVDDGDGGLSFADNYSTIMAKDGKALGFVVGADYLNDEDEGNYVTFEQVGFTPDLPETQQEELLDRYLQGRKLVQQEDLDGVIFQPPAAALAERFAKLYPEVRLEQQENGLIRVNFVNDKTD